MTSARACLVVGKRARRRCDPLTRQGPLEALAGTRVNAGLEAAPHVQCGERIARSRGRRAGRNEGQGRRASEGRTRVPRPLVIAFVELVVVVIAALLFIVFVVSDGEQDDPSRVTQMRLQRVGQTVTPIGTVLSGDSGLQSAVFDWGDGESDVTDFEESGGVWSVREQHSYADGAITACG